MIEIPVPALDEQEIALHLEQTVRGGHGGSGAPGLTGRIALGGPYAVQVTPDYVAGDPDLRTFVEQEAARCTYHVAHLSVSFATEAAGPRLETATVDIRLTAPAGAAEPVAWSMTPLRVTDAVQVERHFRLGPQLQFENIGLSAGEFEQTTSRQRTEIFLQAQRQLRSDPAWEFRRTRTSGLAGSHRLVMVIRAGRKQDTTISVSVRATTKGNLLHRYAQAVPMVAAVESVV